MYPTFGKKRVSEITSADVLAVLLPLWHTKPPTAHAVRQRIGTVNEVGDREGLPTG